MRPASSISAVNAVDGIAEEELASSACLGAFAHQRGEQVLLEFDVLGTVFLDDVGVACRIASIAGDMHPLGQPVDVQSLGGQLRAELAQRLGDGIGQIRAGVADPDGHPIGGKQRRPGQPDGARPDYGGGAELLCHFVLSFR